jgi:L-alanine-DL-glutamate epimerase-like enolase superfamily enzyme
VEVLPRIDAIHVSEVLVPRLERNRVTTSYATLPDAHHALVSVHADGIVGIGEAPAELWWTGEDAASVRNAIERYLAPALVEQPLAIRDATRRMDAALAANAYAKAAVEMALWDLLGKAAGLPLYRLLGGGAARPIPIKYVIGMMEPARAREEAGFAKSLGFSYLKVKVGGQLSQDIERSQAVAGELGSGDQLGVDANGGWTLPTALGALKPLEELGVAFLEQPVSAEFPDAMAMLTARSTIPVVAHESIFSVRDGYQAVIGRWAHIWALTPSTHGGLVRTIDLIGLARAAGIPLLLGSTVELGVATAFLAQIAAAFDEIVDCPVPSDILGPLYHESDIVAVQPVIENGFVHVPDGPGLGVVLDEQAVAHFTVER